MITKSVRKCRPRSNFLHPGNSWFCSRKALRWKYSQCEWQFL